MQVTDPLAEVTWEMLRRLRSNVQCTAVITGEPGAGKSTLALNIGAMAAYLMGVKWDWKKAICWTGEEYLTALAELPKFSTVILNEAGEVLFNRDFQSKGSKALSKGQNTDRVKQKIKLLIIPNLGNLEKNFRDNPNYVFWTYLGGDRRFTDIWKQRPPRNPFQSLSRMSLYERGTTAYSFKKLPKHLYQKYIDLDVAAKERMNEDYRETITGNGKTKGRPRKEITDPFDGTAKEVAARHNVGVRTVQRLRQKARDTTT